MTYGDFNRLTSVFNKSYGLSYGGDIKYTVTNTDSNNLPISFSYFSKEIGDGYSSRSTGDISISYSDYDDFGNWHDTLWIFNLTAVVNDSYGVDSTRKESYSTKFHRTIEYYTPEEVDLPALLRNPR